MFSFRGKDWIVSADDWASNAGFAKNVPRGLADCAGSRPGAARGSGTRWSTSIWRLVVDPAKWSAEKRLKVSRKIESRVAGGRANG